jgi:hypothetical protein
LPWLALLLDPGPTSVSPVDGASSSIIGYIGGFGVLGYLVLALVFRWLVPGRTAERDRAQAREDLEKELARVLADAKQRDDDAKQRETRLAAEARQREERLIAERQHAEDQRDEALKIARNELVPVLGSFTSTTGALIPLLQEVVRAQEGQRGGR